MAAANIVGDGLNTIMNGQRSLRREVSLPASRMLEEIVKIMLRKHYVRSLDVTKEGVKRFLKVGLRYDSNGDGVLTEIKRHSLSSRRVYSKAKNIPRVKNGFATVIVSTPKGMMTGKEARESKVGGEIICHIF